MIREEFGGGVLAAYAVAMLMTTAEGTLLLLYPPYLDAHGYALPAIGALVALLSVMRLASRIPMGAAYSAARAKRLLRVALVALAVATGGFAFAGGQFVPVVALTLMHGSAFGSLGTLVLASVIDLTGGKRAGPVMAWYTAALSSGYAVGALAGGWLGDAVGLEATMIVASALPLAATMVVGRVPLGGTLGDHPPGRPGIRGVLDAARGLDARVWLAFGVVLYLNVISEAVDAFFPLYAIGIGLPLAAVGALKGLKSAAATLVRFASVAIVRVIEPRALNLWGIVLMGLATVLIAHASAFAALAALFVLLGLCRGILRVTSAATVAEVRGDGRAVGLAAGVYSSGLDIGQIIGPLAGGVIGDAFGLGVMFQVMAIVSTAAYFAVGLATAPGRAALLLGRGRRPEPVARAAEVPVDAD